MVKNAYHLSHTAVIEESNISPTKSVIEVASHFGTGRGLEAVKKLLTRCWGGKSVYETISGKSIIKVEFTARQAMNGCEGSKLWPEQSG